MDFRLFISQYLDIQGQSRWYKFQVQPESRVTVTLTDLPANYDLTLYKDIASAFQTLIKSSVDLVRLGAEFAPDAFSPDAFSPDAFSPDAFSPDAFSPDAFSPDAFSPDAFSPDAFSPDAFSPDALALMPFRRTHSVRTHFHRMPSVLTHSVRMLFSGCVQS